MIDQATIAKIMDTVEVVDVISDYINLKKRGVNYLGNCPFHNEKTPSFTVSPAKGIFKCFGCGKAGNSVNFVMEHESLSYPEALKLLAKKYNIEVQDKELTPEQVQRNTERESMMIVSAYAAKYFTETLHHHQQGIAVGLSYFKERGFRPEIIKKFELGYCIESRDEFTKTAVNNGYKKEFLVKTGLTIDKEGRIFDRFWGRVMFPIHNISGKIIAFGGRTLRNDKKTAKYLNSPESEIYHKSRSLYGIFQAKRSITQLNKCYLVEGYTDVMSFHQSGIENVVASSGTSLTQDQVRLIKRFTENVTVVYDGDQAGIKASLRGIDMILEEGLNVKVVPLPDGEDPDSFAKSKSATELEEYIGKNEIDFIRFKTEILLKEGGHDPVQRAGLINDIVKSISMIPNKIVRSVYIRECSSMLDVQEKILYEEVARLLGQKISNEAEAQYKSSNSRQPQYQDQPPPELGIEPTPQKEPEVQEDFLYEKALIKFLLRYGNKPLYQDLDGNNENQLSVAAYVLEEIKTDDILFEHPLCKLIFDDMDKQYEEHKEVYDSAFTNHEKEEVRSLATDMLLSRHELSKYWTKNNPYMDTPEDKLQQSVPELVLKFKNKRINKLLKEVEREIKAPDIMQNVDKMMEVLKRKQLLDQLRVEISRRMGGRVVI